MDAADAHCHHAREWHNKERKEPSFMLTNGDHLVPMKACTVVSSLGRRRLTRLSAAASWSGRSVQSVVLLDTVHSPCEELQVPADSRLRRPLLQWSGDRRPWSPAAHMRISIMHIPTFNLTGATPTQLPVSWLGVCNADHMQRHAQPLQLIWQSMGC